MFKYVPALAILVSIGSETVFARSLNPNAPKAAAEKRMPAASGIAELPAKSSSLLRLVHEINPEIESVIAAYRKTERFTGSVDKNGKKQKIFVDFIQAGRFEPDSPVANNLLIVKSDDGPKGAEGDPYVFILGPIEISSIKKSGPNKFVIQGTGGNAIDGGTKCTFIGVERTLTVEISLDSNNIDYGAKYVDTADKQWCRK